MSKRTLLVGFASFGLLASNVWAGTSTTAMLGVNLGTDGGCDNAHADCNSYSYNGQYYVGPAAAANVKVFRTIYHNDNAYILGEVQEFGKVGIKLTLTINNPDGSTKSASDTYNTTKSVLGYLKSNGQLGNVYAVEIFNEWDAYMSLNDYESMFNSACKQIKASFPTVKVYTGAIRMGSEGDFGTLDKDDCADALGYHPYSGNLHGTGMLTSRNVKTNHQLALTEWGCSFWNTNCNLDSDFFSTALTDVMKWRSERNEPVIEADYYLLNQAPLSSSLNPGNLTLFEGEFNPKLNTYNYDNFKAAMTSYTIGGSSTGSSTGTTTGSSTGTTTGSSSGTTTGSSVGGTGSTSSSPEHLKMVIGNVDLCLDVWQGSTASGAKLDLFTCEFGSGHPNQLFSYQLTGTETSAPIELGDGSKRCVDVSGSGIAAVSCNSNSSQKWERLSTHQFKNVENGLCMDDPSFSTKPGTFVDLWPCKPTTSTIDNQELIFTTD